MSYGNMWSALDMFASTDRWLASVNKNLQGVGFTGFQATRTTFNGAPGSFDPARTSGGRPNSLSQATLNPTTEIDTTQGLLQATGKDTDYAISGDGYFVLEDSSGNLYYTRSGEFKLDGSGRLSVPEGLQVVTESRLIELGLAQPRTLTATNAARLINYDMAGWQRPESRDGTSVWFPYHAGTGYDESGLNYKEQLITMRKSFDLGNGPINATAANSYLDVMSDDWTHIYVNGNWLSKADAIAADSVFGPYNPGPDVDGPTGGGQFGMRTRYDISKYLQPGNNEIVVYSSEVRDSEGVSVMGQIAGRQVTTDIANSLPEDLWLTKIVGTIAGSLQETIPEPFPDQARTDIIFERRASDLALARFADPSKLSYSKFGLHIMQWTPEAGARGFEFSATGSGAKVQRGFLEAANSNAKRETSETAMVQKMYDALTAFTQLQMRAMDASLNIIK